MSDDRKGRAWKRKKVKKVEKIKGKEEKTGKEKVKIAKGKEEERVVKEKKQKVRRKKTKEEKKIEKIRKKIRRKKKPTFRGRFGKRWLRRKSKEKWAKWRKPRGIDIKRRAEDGAIPKSGYRTNKRIRFFHPSGFREKLVGSIDELSNVPKEFAVRFRTGIGKRKRKILAELAKKRELKVLNP